MGIASKEVRFKGGRISRASFGDYKVNYLLLFQRTFYLLSARTFYKNLKKGLQERHMKMEFGRSEDFQSLVSLLRQKFGDESLTDLADENAPSTVGPDQLVKAHPKLAGKLVLSEIQLDEIFNWLFLSKFQSLLPM